MPLDPAGFEASLEGAAPPAGLDPPLAALWYGLAGDWPRAHAIVQGLEGDPAADWVHAWLHRIEGDLGNAGYWYRRAGRPVATGATAEEGRRIAAALLAGGGRDG
jgi:hypothetical protein